MTRIRFLLANVTVLLTLIVLACGKSDSPSASSTPTAPPTPSVVVTTIKVAIADTAPLMGTTTQATATVLDQNGATMTGKNISWKSSNDSLATVDASGLVTAKMRGQVTITASVDAKAGTAAMRVTPTPAYDCDIEETVDEYVVCSKRVLIDGQPANQLLRYPAAIQIDNDAFGDIAYMSTLDDWYAAHPNAATNSDYHWRYNVRFPVTLLRGSSRKGEFTTFVPSVAGGVIDVNLPHEHEQIRTLDVNGDGINDIIIGDGSEFTVPMNGYPLIGAQHYVYLSTGPGAYRKIRIGDTTFTTHGMAVGDEAKDGFTFVFNTPWNCFANYPAITRCATKFVGHVNARSDIAIDTIRVNTSMLNSPGPSYYNDWFASSSYVTAIDIDRRGKKDVITFSSGVYGDIHYLWRKTSNGWQATDSLISGLRSWTGSASTSNIVEDAVVGDFNGDGYDDLALGYIMGGHIRIWINNTHGSFIDRTQQVLGTSGDFQAYGVWLDGCDVNNDGKPDLIHRNIWDSSKGVRIYLNAGETMRLLRLPFNNANAFGAVALCLRWQGTNGLIVSRKEFGNYADNFNFVQHYPLYFVTLRPK